MSETNYRQKRIGYLGLSQLLNEHSPVLMMATNRMILDMQDDNDMVVALPLVLIAELSTEDMCRAMAREVAKVNSFFKKYFNVYFILIILNFQKMI